MWYTIEVDDQRGKVQGKRNRYTKKMSSSGSNYSKDPWSQALGFLDYGLGKSFVDQKSQIRVEECHIGADNMTAAQCLRRRQTTTTRQN